MRLATIALCAALATPGVARAQPAPTAWARCFGGVAEECAAAGEHYLAGSGGVRRSPAWAAQAWQQGCRQEDARSCTHLASLYEEGLTTADVPQDARLAARFYRRGCERGDARGCHGLGRILGWGLGTESQPAEGLPFEIRACRAGVADACGALADVFLQGDGVPADATRAGRLRARACALGDERWCSPSAAEPPRRRALPPDSELTSSGLSAQEIERSLAAIAPIVARCHVRAEAREGPLHGYVRARFTINAQGRSAGVQIVENRAGDATHARCIRRALGRLRFAPPRGPVPPITRTFVVGAPQHHSSTSSASSSRTAR